MRPRDGHEQNKRLWTLTQPWTHRTRPPVLGKLAEEREIPTSVHSPFLFPSEEKNEEHLRRQPSRFTRFQVSADIHSTQRERSAFVHGDLLPEPCVAAM